jgi:SsrA-binding protein
MEEILNKNARREYTIGETWQAGVVLIGAEVKTLRLGRGSLRDAYVKWVGNELYLIGADIPQYTHFSGQAYDPKRTRKLLLKASEIAKIRQRMEGKGMALVPLKLYFRRRFVKCEIGLARGKQAWEKRETIKKRDVEREIARAVKNTRS